jgi:hypothetical protein
LATARSYIGYFEIDDSEVAAVWFYIRHFGIEDSEVAAVWFYIRHFGIEESEVAAVSCRQYLLQNPICGLSFLGRL